MKVEYVIDALKEHFNTDDVEHTIGHDFLVDGDEYMVLDDDGADEMAYLRVEDYVEYNYKSSCDSFIEQYVDWDEMTHDIVSGDDRGTWLAPYDNEEHEITDVKGNDWYVYRQ